MFEQFKNSFVIYTSVPNPFLDIREIPFKYSELLLELGGLSFNKGLYSIHSFESSMKSVDLLSNYFDGYSGEILPFAYDWWGRQYCISKKGYTGIYVFDPIDLKDYYLEEDLIDFHNATLVGDDEILDNSLFREILESLGIDGLQPYSCIGHKIPLFLNGKSEMSNYQVVELEVYWRIQFELYNQIKDLPDQTPVNAIIAISEFQHDNKK